MPFTLTSPTADWDPFDLPDWKPAQAAAPALFAAITAVLFRHDPIGINFEINTDEYDPEAGTILHGWPTVRARPMCVGSCTRSFAGGSAASVTGRSMRPSPARFGRCSIRPPVGADPRVCPIPPLTNGQARGPAPTIKTPQP